MTRNPNTFYTPDCVQCPNCIQKKHRDGGRTINPDGTLSKCDMCLLSCKLDGKSKGYIFEPYEVSRPATCPLITPPSFFTRLVMTFKKLKK